MFLEQSKALETEENYLKVCNYLFIFPFNLLIVIQDSLNNQNKLATNSTTFRHIRSPIINM